MIFFFFSLFNLALDLIHQIQHWHLL